jgi:hypothetical protein
MQENMHLKDIYLFDSFLFFFAFTRFGSPLPLLVAVPCFLLA